MRRLDKLIIKSFIGPFLLTTSVATFVLLIQYMLKYFDDFVGKDLGFSVFGRLLFYFALNMLSVSLPLGVLVSSLMTFGNLGEHFELTAIKGAGISLLRAMRPIFIFVIFLSIGAFFFNNHIVPAANLKAYSLLYDIKHKKPALDIKPGVFYDGIPNYSIYAKRKLNDNKTLQDVMIYDHTDKSGNKTVILADSSIMTTILNEKYLKLELFNGNYVSEQKKSGSVIDQLYRTKFEKMEMVFNLSSFDLNRTEEELFQNNRQMKNISQLTHDIDSMYRQIQENKVEMITNTGGFMKYHRNTFYNKDSIMTIEPQEDTVQKLQTASLLNLPLIQERKVPPRVPYRKIQTDSSITVRKSVNPTLDTMTLAHLNERYETRGLKDPVITRAITQARNFKVSLNSSQIRIARVKETMYKYIVEKYKKYSQAAACIVMFLIGAPLGAIIKKGGLGVPVIISIFFFILYYVVSITSEKWAKAGMIDGRYAVWVSDLVLLPIGLFFLRQARIDARLFDTDFYHVVIDKLQTRLKSKFNQ